MRRFMRMQRVSLLLLVLFAAGGAVFANTGGQWNQMMDQAFASGSARVIVKLTVPGYGDLIRRANAFPAVSPLGAFPEAGRQALAELNEALALARGRLYGQLDRCQFRVNREYRSLPFVALTADTDTLAVLASMPEVEAVWEDRLIRLNDPLQRQPRLGGDNPDPRGANQLNNTVNVIGASDAWSLGYTGSGWYVAVLDTGILTTHQFFAGKTIVEACYASGESGGGDCPNGSTSMVGTGAAAHFSSTYEGYDHSTHVSGIATGNNGTLKGVAPDANIIAVKVFSRFSASACGGAVCIMSYDSDQVAGLDYVYSLRSTYSIASVNMSLGGGKYSSACDSESQKTAIDNLRSAGIATCIATGNDGYCGYISAPACISTAVSVGAVTDAGAEASFNNWSPTLQTFWAPGVSVNSSTAASTSSYESWSGTSMATPHVAGAWALLKQAKPAGTVSEFVTALVGTGTSIATGCSSPSGSRPLIQVDAAIQSIVSPTPKVTVTSPNGGESWAKGATKSITWTSTLVTNVKIELLKAGSLVSTISASTAASAGTYSWTIPTTLTAGTDYTVRITDTGDSTVTDVSNAVFAITDASTASITVTAPNGGESWKRGTSHTISWTYSNVSYVKIQLLKAGSVVSTLVSSRAASYGYYTWSISRSLSAASTYQIKITSTASSSVTDTSNAYFSITK